MDHWDPAVTDGFAQDRPVLLFDNAGVAGSSGKTPDTIEAMADYAAAFVGALDLSKIDVLGFSIGGYISQALVLRHPALVRRLILAGTGPRGGDASDDPKYGEYAVSTDPVTGEGSLEAFLYLFLPHVSRRYPPGAAFDASEPSGAPAPCK
jgi:pimeloyl-ACP methyl ester carboxylesterase